ncbi:endoplasmic reticulum mannosyl-oligosaccharide 1,2-alpha-mannosidase-like isoform X1 [Planococcus citri]|uniref:endoplasmic reticulum mannosyl-oligosaccharide 1,2-alpha-mannosidase-like isoform X1 n=1 Tax=Planococcus citri TaxID=170843 RepID=UPI0031F95903
MKKQYVTLNLENINRVPVLQHRSSHRKSLWRAWRQLSRLQKNLIVTLWCSIILVIFYWVIFNSQRGLDDVKSDKHIKEPDEDGQKVHEDVDETFQKIPEIDSKVVVDKLFVEEPVNKKPIQIDETRKAQPFVPKPQETITVRQRAVVNAVKHAWTGYKKYAWGHDHLRPISLGYQDWFHLGMTIVDSLDTLYIMNLTKEFGEAREWVEKSFIFDHRNDDVNLFEVTIRILGGLLSAYHFSNDGLFLEKAADLGERLLPCFEKSPTAIPFSDVNLVSHTARVPRWSSDSSIAEVSTLQLEFRDLSRCTKEPKFEKAAFAVSEHIHKLRKPDGLVPIFINPNTGNFNFDSEIKLGARGDSYYEYLLKQWIQTGKTVDFLKQDYIEAIDGIMKTLTKTTPKRKLTFIGELKSKSRTFSPKMDHLTCYLPGTLALGVHNGMPNKHMKFAEQLMETCYYMYKDQPTGLAPEIVYFNYEPEKGGVDMYVHSQDTHNLLRPEFIESLWAMYSITGNETYQQWGWEIFQALEKYTKVANGYTCINNVLDPENTKPRDFMESYFMSETLKYLYLLFSPNRRLIDIDKLVMNSEAHPLPIYSY